MDFVGLIGLVPALVGAGLAIWKQVQASRYADALVTTERSVDAMIAAVELMPAGEAKTQAKRAIAKLATATGAEQGHLRATVREVTELLKREDAASAESDDERLRRIESALYVARAKREQQRRGLGPKAARIAGAALLVAGVSFGGAGCAGVRVVEAYRLTQEDVVRDDRGRVSEIAVTWPAAVRDEEDVVTVRGEDGRLVTFAPVEVPAP